MSIIQAAFFFHYSSLSLLSLNFPRKAKNKNLHHPSFLQVVINMSREAQGTQHDDNIFIYGVHSCDILHLEYLWMVEYLTSRSFFLPYCSFYNFAILILHFIHHVTTWKPPQYTNHPPCHNMKFDSTVLTYQICYWILTIFIKKSFPLYALQLRLLSRPWL